ncbi:hypothetical protein Glove_99g211 [Diversispora epigaea]|uniref:RNase H type-1 domain-containing protein n=1 Tax=Diversispora epigaea TaxID=1348612 RepID=A0A397JDI2_9GLOM|nr:hypothetical protein Glove_99g211 [Diversispora epigaea]
MIELLSIHYPASSTRAELWEILSVLWVASHKTSITIFTDSESSIKAIKGYIEGKKGKHWSNYSNPHVLQVIKEIINTKELNIVLEKVEAHKGDLLNEQADKLAKLGVNSGSNFEINPNFIREQQCHFTWNKQEIDAGIKEFVKKKDEIESTTTWFLQHRINNWLNKNIINETNWKWSIETWHETKITNNKTNSKENSLRAFSLKLLNEELPTMATLHTRKPNIYTSTECPFCKKYKETNSHIFMCADYGKILKSTFRSIIKRIYIKEKGNIGLHDLMSKITRGHFLKINYHRQILGTQPSDRFEFNDLVKGLIPKSIYRLIRKKVNSTETGKNMVMEIFCSWKRTLYSRWKNRCKDFLNWEIKNDIGESDKKSKASRPSSASALHPSSASASRPSLFPRPLLESEDSDLTSSSVDQMNDAVTRRIFSKLDNLKTLLEKVKKNQEDMKEEIKIIKEEVAILSHDQACIDVSIILKFEHFANVRNINNFYK